MLGLAPGVGTETLLLSPQGKLEAALGVVDDGASTWLIVEPAQARYVGEWLTKMRFAMRVSVVDDSQNFAVLGFNGDVPAAAAGYLIWEDPWPHVAPGGTRYGPGEDIHPGVARRWKLVAVPAAAARDVVADLAEQGFTPAGTWAAEAMRIAAWRPGYGSEVDARTIAHEVDWLRTAVHLHKGCYRGQETIARVHNLGRPPRRLVFLHLDGSADVLPEHGSGVLAAGRVVGTVTSSVRHHELGPIALALIKRSVAADAPLDVVSQSAPDVVVSAAQEPIVDPSGQSVDRPAGHGPLMKGLPRVGMIQGT
ncbi:folate-binding protein YgfZ [Rarobacter incanus]